MSFRFAIAPMAATATASIDCTSDAFRDPRPCYPPAGASAKPSKSVGWATWPASGSKRSPCRPTGRPDFGLTAHDEHGYAPSANPFRLSDLGNVLEVEPNDAITTPTPFTVPMAVNGVISKPGDTDFFKFAGKRGQVLDVRVFARSLGSPLDPQVGLHRADGSWIQR